MHKKPDLFGTTAGVLVEVQDPILDYEVVGLVENGFEVLVPRDQEQELFRRAKAAGFKVVKKPQPKPKIKEGRLKAASISWDNQVEKVLGAAVSGIRPEGSGVVLDLHCEEGCKETWTSPNRIPPPQIASKLKRLGWRLGRHPKCPTHNGHNRNRQKETTEMPTPAAKTPTAPPLTQAQASDAARLAKRLVLADLETHFDDVNCRYKPGHSDATIAKNTNVAEQVVKNLREEFYGELKAPSELDALRQELAMLTARKETQDRLFLEQVDALHGRLDTLAKKNGWKA